MGSSDAAGKRHMQEQGRLGSLRVASTMTAMHLSGFIGELSEELARRLGYAGVEWVPMGWDKLTAADHPEYDLAVQIISIKPERWEKVDFSDPFLLANQALLVRQDTPIAQATSLEQLRAYLLGGMQGGAGTACIRQVIRPEQLSIEFDHPFTAGKALADGQVDGIVFPAPVAIALAKQFKTTVVVGQITTNEEYGVVFDKGSPLRERVNGALHDMRTDGTWRRIVDHWFPEMDELRPLG
jgi:polar amino acid transport system substrate-binding protein